MDGDVQLEVLGPVDTLNIGVYKRDGTPVRASTTLCTQNPFGFPLNWGHISVSVLYGPLTLTLCSFGGTGMPLSIATIFVLYLLRVSRPEQAARILALRLSSLLMWTAMVWTKS
jgi:hypothetical protein